MKQRTSKAAIVSEWLCGFGLKSDGKNIEGKPTRTCRLSFWNIHENEQ